MVRDTGGQTGVLAAPMRAVARNAQAGFPEGLAMRFWMVWAAHGSERQLTEETAQRRESPQRRQPTKAAPYLRASSAAIMLIAKNVRIHKTFEKKRYRRYS